MLNPINEAFSGVIQNLKTRLKLGKNVPKKEEENNKNENIIEINAGLNVNIQASNHVDMGNNVGKNDLNEVDLEFKQNNGPKNKEYNSIQIDFEQNNNNVIDNHAKNNNENNNYNNSFKKV